FYLLFPVLLRHLLSSHWVKIVCGSYLFFARRSRSHLLIFINYFLAIFCFSWHRPLRRTIHRSVHCSSTHPDFLK
ncbi:MAG TPA: hypothetical protein VN451_11355, partial [Chitinophagaceae bacterium]|nr:hypothetical protein [Chitinophagaceae bacterium]